MKIQYLFPLLLISLDMFAAAVYASQGDWRKNNILDCGSCAERSSNILNRE